MPAPISFDRIADRYDATRGGERRGREFAAQIRPHLRPGSALEVGVGTGVVAAALHELGITVAGFDISAAMAAQAHRRLGGRVGLADARALPVGRDAVDNVIFVMALHVVGGVDAALEEAARVLRPGGRVVAIHDAPIVETVDDDVARILQPLQALRRDRPDTTRALDAAATRAGLRLVHHGLTEPVGLAHSPAATAADIEARTWSYLWRIDETQWQRLVEPCLAALRALPDPEQTRPYAQRQRLSVFSA